MKKNEEFDFEKIENKVYVFSLKARPGRITELSTS